MRIFMEFLVPIYLATPWARASEPLKLDVHTKLQSDPATQIHLVPTGCWTGLMLSATTHPTCVSPSRRRLAEATVEVWDVAFREISRQETFRLFKEALFLSLRTMWRFAPPSHSRIDAAIRAGNGSGAGTDLSMVQSLQQRFNGLPPNGSPVQQGATGYR